MLSCFSSKYDPMINPKGKRVAAVTQKVYFLLFCLDQANLFSTAFLLIPERIWYRFSHKP